MILSINSIDYTAALDHIKPLAIERKLNQPVLCRFFLSFGLNSTLVIPAAKSRILVVGDDGTAYFTGYIVETPVPEYAGMAITGPQYRYLIEAFSDEVLLDQSLMPASSIAPVTTLSAALTNLVIQSGSSTLSTSGLTALTPISALAAEPGANFSKTVGLIADQTRSAYHAINGALQVENVGGTVHILDETQGTLTFGNLAFSAGTRRALANDITVCGQHEPVAYVTEYFLGDGTTTQFYLSQAPFALSGSKSKIISELFNEGTLPQNLWDNSGQSNYISLGAGGLTFNGGSGIDGGTVVAWVEPVEISGTLMLEALGVSLAPGSSGVLAAFSTGHLGQANCMAGILVTSAPTTGAVAMQPLINGTPSGTAYQINSNYQYNLRVRVNCPEYERSQAVYHTSSDSGTVTTGGQLILTGANITVEIQESANGITAMPVVLYDGAIANTLGNATIVAASSINLIGSMRAINLKNQGSGWVVTTPNGGAPYTRRIGSLVEGAECHVETSGKCVFYNGYQPPAGELVAVTYRTIGRAVGRAINSASQATLAAAGLPSTASWIGTVTNPPARSSADCRNAALALEQAAASASTVWAGLYQGTQLNFSSDVWPGDILQIVAPSLTLNLPVIVRTVEVTYSSTTPDIFNYKIRFANEWAEDLAIKTSETVPTDAWLPAAIQPTYLKNLRFLTINSVDGSNINCTANVTLPPGGGIEVRLRDFAFGPGNDSDLVMRGAATNLIITRMNINDRFYVRMYDGNTPPNYSEFSSALFINLPLATGS